MNMVYVINLPEAKKIIAVNFYHFSVNKFEKPFHKRYKDFLGNFNADKNNNNLMARVRILLKMHIKLV